MCVATEDPAAEGEDLAVDAILDKMENSQQVCVYMLCFGGYLYYLAPSF